MPTVWFKPAILVKSILLEQKHSTGFLSKAFFLPLTTDHMRCMYLSVEKKITQNIKYYSLVPLLQIILIVATLSHYKHEDVRFLFPLLPYIALLLTNSLIILKNKFLNVCVLFCLITQLFIINLQAFRIIPITTQYTFHGLRPLFSIESENKIIAKKIIQVCNKQQTSTVALATFRRCGGYQIQYEALKLNKHIRFIDIFSLFEQLLKRGYLGSSQTNDEDKLWKTLMNEKFDLFITLHKNYYPKDYPENPWTYWEDRVTQRIMHTSSFIKIDDSTYPELLIYKRIN